LKNLKINPVEISSTNGNYFATFHDDIESLEKEIISKVDSFILIDEQVSKTYSNLMEIFPKERYFIVESNEENKSLSKVGEICNWLMNLEATKTSHLIAIGGGVIQDLATFCSHIYYRGIKWSYFPTTLLSQADSCIGAKCALNLNGHKNQLGVVHTPSAVEIYSGFLATLPFSEIQSGFGEIAKLAVTGENQFLKEFEEYLGKHGFSIEHIASLVRLSLVAKKYVIDQDEYESDLRRILNYGHSFGHALEALTKNSVVHGDAVVVGMDLINFIGFKLGITNREFYLEMKKLFDKHFNHIEIGKTISPEVWVNELKHDKKMQHGKMNFAIPVSTGDIRIYKMDLDQELINLVGDYIESSAYFHSA